MNDILAKIVEQKRADLRVWQAARGTEDMRRDAAAMPPARNFAAALRGPRPRGATPASGRLNVISEVKRKSPSKGHFPWHGDAPRQARDYVAGGAAAISVVTDGPFFDGSLELFAQVRAAVDLPMIQKDFVLEPWQVYQARAIGADACLLIAAILPPALLAELHACATEIGLHALVEVTDEAEWEAADAAGAQIIGVNNRDLRDFSVDTQRTRALLPRYREEQICVAESGLHIPEDLLGLHEAGVDAYLIGESLMRAEDPAAHLRALSQPFGAGAEQERAS